MTPIVAGLFVFAMRVIDMSLDTLRLLFVMRGRRLLAGVIGAVQAAVFILAVSAVLRGPLNFWTVLGYAAGFGCGIILGMLVEDKLALGYNMIDVYTLNKGKEITSALRAKGYAVTEFNARGKDGSLRVIQCIVLRKDVNTVKEIIESTDPNAFLTIGDVKSLRRGHFRH